MEWERTFLSQLKLFSSFNFYVKVKHLSVMKKFVFLIDIFCFVFFCFNLIPVPCCLSVTLLTEEHGRNRMFLRVTFLLYFVSFLEIITRRFLI